MFQNQAKPPDPPTESAGPPLPSQGRSLSRSLGDHRILLGLVLATATLVLYNPVSKAGFLSFDDDRYVTGNPRVRDGLHSGLVTWAFTTYEQANWHPLTWLSHALDCQLFQLNPAGHHYTNLLLHSGNALLLFFLLQWFTGYTGRSLMVAALFAVHPLNVESVAWIAERKNVLCLFFCLLAIGAYGWYVRKPGIGRYAVVAVLIAMSLMAKPMAVTLPMLLLLLDYWPLGRMRFADAFVSSEDLGTQVPSTQPSFAPTALPFSKLLLEKLPLMALSLVSAVITMAAQRSGGAVLTAASHSPLLRIGNALVCYAIYLKKAGWPSSLAALYPYPHEVPIWQAALAAVFLIAVTGVVLKYREHRYLATGWFWFLGTMVPMIGLVQVGNQAMADRYAYLPLIGIFIMAVWLVVDCVDRPGRTNFLTAAGILVLLALSAVTRTQIAYWHDDASLWAHALEVTRNNFVAENSYGVALMKQGRRGEGIAHFRTAEALEPKDPTNQLNLGVYAQEQGDLPQAAARYEWVLQLATDEQLRASAYANLGPIYFSLGKYPQAKQNLEAAVRLGRVYPAYFLDLGLIAQKDGDWNNAANNFVHLVGVEPSDVAYLLLAHALTQGGHIEEAHRAELMAKQISPDLRQAQETADRVTLK